MQEGEPTFQALYDQIKDIPQNAEKRLRQEEINKKAQETRMKNKNNNVNRPGRKSKFVAAPKYMDSSEFDFSNKENFGRKLYTENYSQQDQEPLGKIDYKKEFKPDMKDPRYKAHEN